MKKYVVPAILLSIVAACASMATRTATANLASISGSNATGTVTLRQLADGSVDVSAEFTGVPPGVHGFHIHEKGDCGDNGNAAGAHFNPGGAPHGAPGAPAHHAGDWGNVAADASGKVSTRFNTRAITLAEGASSAVGRAVILHASPDDLTTQPSGNAGARIACGVVRLQ